MASRFNKRFTVRLDEATAEVVNARASELSKATGQPPDMSKALRDLLRIVEDKKVAADKGGWASAYGDAVRQSYGDVIQCLAACSEALESGVDAQRVVDVVRKLIKK